MLLTFDDKFTENQSVLSIEEPIDEDPLRYAENGTECVKNVPWLLNSSDKYVEKSRSRSMRAKEILRLEKPKDVVFD